MVMILTQPLRRSLQLLRAAPAAANATVLNLNGSIGRPSALRSSRDMWSNNATGTNSTSSRRHFITSNNGVNCNGRLTTTIGTTASNSWSATPTSRHLLTTEKSIHQDATNNVSAANQHDDESESETAGREAYQEYQNVKAKLREDKEEKERVKSEKMYLAWQRANEKQAEHNEDEEKKKPKNKSSGVAVVKTLVKQTHKDKETAQAEKTKWQEQAQGLLEKAALEFGYPLALVQLGNQELEQAQQDFGRKLPHNHMDVTATAKEKVDHALDLYRKGGQGGAPEGWFNLGNLLWTGYPDQTEADYTSDEILLPVDQKASVEAFRQAMELGDADAMYFLGVHLLSTEDEDEGDDASHPITDDQIKDMGSGLALIEMAGGVGHGGALYYLALLHLNGHAAIGIPACSPPDFVKHLDAAVEAGDSDALFLRGHSFYEGDSGYPLDYGKALADFLLASDADNADAAISAGAILHRGHPGVPQNHTKAFELYQHAGELGSIEGWRNVVACYLTGEGVPRSKEIAKYIAETMLKE
jgi:TPR repeat protein